MSDLVRVFSSSTDLSRIEAALFLLQVPLVFKSPSPALSSLSSLPSHLSPPCPRSFSSLLPSPSPPPPLSRSFPAGFQPRQGAAIQGGGERERGEAPASLQRRRGDDGEEAGRATGRVRGGEEQVGHEGCGGGCGEVVAGGGRRRKENSGRGVLSEI
eukprot:16566-Hanusia_phi.AAC.2